MKTWSGRAKALDHDQAEVAEWQTRWTQNPVSSQACGFESHLRHSSRFTNKIKSFLSFSSPGFPGPKAFAPWLDESMTFRSLPTLGAFGFLVGCLATILAQSPPPNPMRLPLSVFPMGRSTPREALETFAFAWDAMKIQLPGSMRVAETCIDFPPGTSAAEKGQLTVMLGEILDLLSPPFVGITATQTDKEATLYRSPSILLQMDRAQDGSWRFNRATVTQLPASYEKTIANNRDRLIQKARFTDGLGDQTELFETFFQSALAGQWENAANCLDLGEIAPDKRRTEGPRLAALLAGSIQRLGYVHFQDVPNDPNRPPYAWYTGPEGGIICSEAKPEVGAPRWLFNRATVRRIDPLWNLVKNRPVDHRWGLLGRVISSPETIAKQSIKPDKVPEEFSSPRKVMEGFLRAMDEAEHDDSRIDSGVRFLDFSSHPKEEISRIGPKYAEKLEIILRKLRPSIRELDDRWSAPTAVIEDKALRVRLVRKADGNWSFSDDTVLRIPMMFDSLQGSDKEANEWASGRSNPRETFITFIKSVNDRRLEAAAECLDLGDLPVSARSQMGPLLALKLKSVIDHIGYVYLHEIPSESQGPKYVWHRGPIGRITLARHADKPELGWRFTQTTVAGIDQAIENLLNQPIDPILEKNPNIHSQVSWWEAPGLRLRQAMPPLLRTPLAGLQLWQGIGVLLLGAMVFFGLWLLSHTIEPLVSLLFGGPTGDDRTHLHRAMRSIQVLVLGILAWYLVPCLDLPTPVAAWLYSLDEFVMTFLWVWASFGLVDLILLWLQQHRQRHTIQGFQDLIFPFLGRLAKIIAVIAGVTFLVSFIDDGTLMGRFLAGLGVVGLAVSLAAQDSLKNLFATMLLIGDRSFRAGDLVVVQGEHGPPQEGTIVSVGFRSTRLKTKEDSVLLIPNSNLANSVIDNLGMRQHRRIHGEWFLPTDSPAEGVIGFREEWKRWLDGRPEIDHARTELFIQGHTSQGIKLRYTVYVKGGAQEETRLREEMTIKILDLCHHGKLGHMEGAEKA